MQSADLVVISVPARTARPWWPWVVILLAWAVFIGTTLTHTAYLLEHHDWLARPGLAWWVVPAIFLGSWYLMLAAMMLPCVQPHLRNIRPSSRTHIPFVSGYLGVWTLFGLVALVADTGVLWLLTRWDVLALHPWVIGVGLIALAGVYQFTSAKRHALQGCCTAIHGEVVTHAAPAWRHGIALGWASLRAEWALMLIMFGVGMTNLTWLIALTLLMMLEHLVPWRQRIGALAGVTLLVVAALWLGQATAPDTAVALASSGFFQTQHPAGMTISLRVDPAHYGANTLMVTVLSNQSVPLTNAHVVVETIMLDMDMGAQDILLTPLATTLPGDYRGMATLSMPGRWQITVTVTAPDLPSGAQAVYRFAIAT